MASILIIVPKDDEFRGVKREFGIPNGTRGEHIPHIATIYHSTIAGRSLAIAVLNHQNNTQSGVLTAELIRRENPRQIFLIGTALGRIDIPVGSVIIGAKIGDITETRQSSSLLSGPILNRISDPDGRFIESVNSFIEQFESKRTIRLFYSSIGSEDDMDNDSYLSTKERVSKSQPVIAVEPILSGNEYVMIPDDPANNTNNNSVDSVSIWGQFREYKAYDMEAGGFCLAAALQNVPWLVIRAISDHGTKESKGNRIYTTQAAAKLLRAYIEHDPARIDQITSSKPRLSSTLSRRLVGSFWGFMGYYDDDDDEVVYHENVTIESIGESLEAEVQSYLIRGTAIRSLDYRVTIKLGDQLSFSGAWGPSPSSQNKYFGSLAGHVTSDYETVNGVWTGGHREGIRIGRFVWYSMKASPQSGDILNQRMKDFITLLEQQIRRIDIDTQS